MSLFSLLVNELLEPILIEVLSKPWNSKVPALIKALQSDNRDGGRVYHLAVGVFNRDRKTYILHQKNGWGFGDMIFGSTMIFESLVLVPTCPMMYGLNNSAWTPISTQRSTQNSTVASQVLSLKHLLHKQNTSHVTSLTLDFTSEPWNRDLSTGYIRYEDHVYHFTNLLYQFSSLKKLTVIFPDVRTLQNHHQKLGFPVAVLRSPTTLSPSPNFMAETASLARADCCLNGRGKRDNLYAGFRHVNGRYIRLEKGVHPDDLARTWVWENGGQDVLRPVEERKPSSEIIDVCARR